MIQLYYNTFTVDIVISFIVFSSLCSLSSCRVIEAKNNDHTREIPPALLHTYYDKFTSKKENERREDALDEEIENYLHSLLHGYLQSPNVDLERLAKILALLTLPNEKVSINADILNKRDLIPFVRPGKRESIHNLQDDLVALMLLSSLSVPAKTHDDSGTNTSTDSNTDGSMEGLRIKKTNS